MVVALAVVVCVLATGGYWAQSGAEAAAAHGPHVLDTHGPHALDSGWPAGFGAAVEHEHPVVEHPHAQDASNLLVADSFAAAPALRQANTSALVGLGLAVAVLALATWWFYVPPAAVRGPPRVAALVLSNRTILTRLCIARR